MFAEFSSKPALFADAVKTTRYSLGSEHSTSFVFVLRLTCEVCLGKGLRALREEMTARVQQGVLYIRNQHSVREREVKEL